MAEGQELVAGDRSPEARVRAILELVHDPAVEVYKRAIPGCLSPRACDVLRSRCRALLRHCWGLLEAAYGVSSTQVFYSVHRVGDPLNCLTLTPDAHTASCIARWWAGPAVEVSAVLQDPERYVGMGVALHWTRPAWLR